MVLDIKVKLLSFSSFTLYIHTNVYTQKHVHAHALLSVRAQCQGIEILHALHFEEVVWPSFLCDWADQIGRIDFFPFLTRWLMPRLLFFATAT